MEQSITFITKTLNHPFLSWVTLPISIIIFGTVTGAKQTGFQLLPFLLLFIFLLLTVLLERLLIKKTKQQLDSPRLLNHIFWIAVAILLILIWATTNWLCASILILYILFIYSAYHPILKMEQTVFYVILQVFFKVYMMSYISFYIQTGYLEPHFLLYLVPIIFFLLAIIVYRQRGMLKYENNGYQSFIGIYYLPLIIGSYLIGVGVIMLLLNIQGANLTQFLIFTAPLLLFFILLLLKKFRLHMRMDNYMNFVIMVTIILYAFMVKYT
ncbi:hypothetical protein [Jeotgalibaca sp. A122]|uniref:hypothetical protein n=1 Tax=Jeotgalibaca sp. A122 TaxID=3457322 RepID=UPI003FD26CE0